MQRAKCSKLCKNWGLALVVTFVISSPSILHAINQNNVKDNIESEGQRIAQEKCSRCHAIGNLGDSSLKQAPPFRTFSKKWPIESLEEALAEGITVGHSEMPEFKFETNEIGALIAYIKSLE